MTSNGDEFKADFGGSPIQPDEEGLLSGMDAYDSSTHSSNRKRSSNSNNNSSNNNNKRLPLAARRFFGGDASEGDNNNNNDGNDDGTERKKQIARWPYDDYHEIQTRYYEVLDQRNQEDELGDADSGSGGAQSYVTRPPDLPDIPTAVQGLPLIEFEKKAEERAIGIVSTWIFDAGLIDELLLNTPSPMMMDTSASSGPGNGSTSGIEVGLHGHPLEGSQKMDKEIEKLRESTQRELALINNRLNDGVAASGSEVQELVNAVAATKGDLARMRELTTYISNGGDLEAQHQFLLTNYPKLKTAVNARRNLARCFRELDFFSQIPATCDRLREELNACEWTDHEWSTIRDVCREHVELQLFLVEAEAGMKNRIQEEDEEDESFPQRTSSHRGLRKDGNSFRYAPTSNNHDSVDQFLDQHVKNVWELGEEIRLRVLSGIGTAFDLAQQNPAGMVALVEAVEVYETAAEEFRSVHKDDPVGSKNRITDLRSTALSQIAEDFEVRSSDVFRSMTQKAADDAGSGGDTDTAQFNAILRAANNLTYQMELVKRQLGPCFPPYWNVETLWMTCVAAVCSQHILQQIGGQEGNYLPDMTVTQLLDLVAWIESFRAQVDEAFPNIVTINAKKARFASMKELMKGKEIDMETAKENLSWVANVLFDVHRLAQDQFIIRTRFQTQEWLDNVYNADHAKTQTTEGRLTTSLPEDLFALAGVQLRTIRERLTKKSKVLVDAVTIVFTMMQLKQRETRNVFLVDVETCCAAANDFVRMSEQAEDILHEVISATDLPPDAQDTLEEVANELMRQYTNDAVFAAQSVHQYIFEPLEEELAEQLFSEHWEEMTHNEHALTIVRTIEDYMGDIEEWMEQLMVRKVVDALVKAAINFYIKHLLIKAEKKSAKDSCFKENNRALQRILGDIKVVRGYFESLVDTFPALDRIIKSEFEILKAIYGLLYMACEGEDMEDVEEYFPTIQKFIRNVNIVRFLVGDLFHLVNPKKEKGAYEVFERHEEQLKAFEVGNDTYVDEQYIDKGLQLDRVVLELIGESKRKRPIKGETMKSVEKAFAGWGWGGGSNMEDNDADAANDDDDKDTGT